MAEEAQPLGEHASEVGVAPRLRSLRIQEEPEGSPTPGTTPRALTPRALTPTRGASLCESERSPFRARHSPFDPGHARHPHSGRLGIGLQRSLFIAIGVLCLVAAAFYAGTAVSGAMGPSRQSLRTVHSTVGGSGAVHFASQNQPLGAPSALELGAAQTAAQQQRTASGKASGAVSATARPQAASPAGAAGSLAHSLVARAKPEQKRETPVLQAAQKTNRTARKSPAGKSAKTDADFAESIAKAVAYSSAKESQAALSMALSPQHLKIHLADLQPKYNKVLLDGYLRLGDDVSAEVGGLATSPQRTADAWIADPFGARLGEGAGFHDSDPSTLDVLFYSLLRQSPLLTEDAERSDVVFVAFWVQKLVKMDQELEKPNRYDLAMTDFWMDVHQNLPLLGKKPHIIVVPGREADLRGTCGGHGLDFLCHPLAANFTVMTPEVLTGRPGTLAAARVAPGLIGSLKEGASSVAIPDLANWHLPEGTEAVTPFAAAEVQSSKLWLVAESFRPRAPIRKALRAQCLAQPAACVHAEPPASSHGETGAYKLASRRANAEAWFCLHPPGDTALRQAFYDCLLSGAVPVVFDTRLPKILPFADVVVWETFLANVAADDVVKNKRDIFELLEGRYPEEDRLARLAVLHKIQHLFQYSLAPEHRLIRFDHLDAVTPRDDAFTMSMKAVLRRACKRGELRTRCPK